LARRKKIGYDIAVIGKIATRLPNNMNDDIDRKKIKEEAKRTVTRRAFLKPGTEKLFRKKMEEMRRLQIIKAWRKKNGNKNKPSGEKILSPA